MAEELDLTTPIVDTKTTDSFVVTGISMNVDIALPSPPVIPPETPAPPVPGAVTITVKDNNGLSKVFQYSGTLAQDMIRFINTGDFTTRSLQKRILEKLAFNGEIAGTVTGTPEVPSAPTGLE